MLDEQLAAVRRYTSAEVVQMLNVPTKWLKELVRDRRVPHQRTGATKGVWFTAADVLEIGRMLPALMSRSQMGAAADSSAPSLSAGLSGGPTGPEVAPDVVAGWARLTAHRPRARRSA